MTDSDALDRAHAALTEALAAIDRERARTVRTGPQTLTFKPAIPAVEYATRHAVVAWLRPYGRFGRWHTPGDALCRRPSSDQRRRNLQIAHRPYTLDDVTCQQCRGILHDEGMITAPGQPAATPTPDPDAGLILPGLALSEASIRRHQESGGPGDE